MHLQIVREIQSDIGMHLVHLVREFPGQSIPVNVQGHQLDHPRERGRETPHQLVASEIELFQRITQSV